MAKIHIVLDVDNCKALKAFASETKADDYAYDYYERTGIDTRVEEVFYDNYKEQEEE